MKLFLFYLFLINLIGFLLMLIDKRRAIRKEWRISERTLLGICLFGGSLGALLAMLHFRHKTKHFKFKYGIPLIILFQCILIVLIKLKG